MLFHQFFLYFLLCVRNSKMQPAVWIACVSWINHWKITMCQLLVWSETPHAKCTAEWMGDLFRTHLLHNWRIYILWQDRDVASLHFYVRHKRWSELCDFRDFPLCSGFQDSVCTCLCFLCLKHLEDTAANEVETTQPFFLTVAPSLSSSPKGVPSVLLGPKQM